ncbi:acetyl-CoA carboxylase [Gordoniibacillus kamchatkensis]|uniref:Biotin carboxyl carrier protein of acetyl-CoA carboxylase n=1 Tax=Gordoniibacillus kamchatkensis TaxID=1590651 RepID=A0ABR5AKR2_9BACL|nr:acetyl-CoA carboxylase biotin carboxyl carrier protein [Paenibacillus sp. VKM B-2647]KIL41110.1 acetyl-CoA carboxylase [Paenibacillus sp. VKM B-2647]
MFKLSEIKELMKLMDQTSLHELEIENEGSHLLIRKPGKTESVIVAPAAQHTFTPVVSAPAPFAPAAAAGGPAAAADQAASGEEDAGLHKIVSPMVGTFYAAPSPGAAPFVTRGSKVSDKTTVCIIEAMKLMNQIEAEVNGEIVDILVENGQLVEYGQPLFLVKPH